MSSKPRVIFNAERHSYTFEGKKCTSVNKVISFFTDPFDEGYWGTYKALEMIVPNFKEIKNDRYSFPLNAKPPTEFFIELISDIPPEEFFKAKKIIKDKWLASSTDGTAFHEMMEESYYTDGFVKNPWDGIKYACKRYKKDYDNQSIVEDLSELKDGVYPELLVWNAEHLITGQADLVFIGTSGEGRHTDIDDHKTTEKKPSNVSSKKMKEPVSHLKDSKLMKYTLQMSFYQRLLELVGFKPRYTALTHYIDYDRNRASRIELRYMRDEVDAMMAAFLKLNPAEEV